MIEIFAMVAVAVLFVVFGLLNRGAARTGRCGGCPGPDNPESCGNCVRLHKVREFHDAGI